MRAKEFIIEAKVGTLYVGGLVIDVDDHIYDRKATRRVALPMIDRAVRRLENAKDQIVTIEPGQQFWVYNTALNIGLGLRKLGDENKVLLKTVVDKRPFDGPNPIIEI